MARNPAGRAAAPLLPPAGDFALRVGPGCDFQCGRWSHESGQELSGGPSRQGIAADPQPDCRCQSLPARSPEKSRLRSAVARKTPSRRVRSLLVGHRVVVLRRPSVHGARDPEEEKANLMARACDRGRGLGAGGQRSGGCFHVAARRPGRKRREENALIRGPSPGAHGEQFAQVGFQSGRRSERTAAEAA